MSSASPPYARVILKISGESFAKPDESGIDPAQLALIASEIVAAADGGMQIAVVVGGGNIVRGARLAQRGHIDQSTADYMGMLATVINGIALHEALVGLGKDSRLMTAIDIPAVGEPFIRARALRHFEKGRVLVLAAGTGNPYFTTDTCAALRGAELNADVLLKATKVDGIYDADPMEVPDAVRYDQVTYDECLAKNLRAMDATALSLCRENSMPIILFSLKTEGNILRVVCGEHVGTRIVHRVEEASAGA